MNTGIKVNYFQIQKQILEAKEKNETINFNQLAKVTNINQARSFSFSDMETIINQVTNEETYILFLETYFNNFDKVKFLQNTKVLSEAEKKQIKIEALKKQLQELESNEAGI